jgi:molecular chaperone GrpE
MVKSSKKKDDSPSEVEQQLAQVTEALQRERADAINQRRRFDEQLASVRASVKSSVIADILPVIDNFERALKHVPKDLEDNEYVKGVQGVVRQFEKVLEGMGVERIPTLGQLFNPHYHEAVSMEEGEGDSEIVSEELQPGYKIGNDVIRHAMVRVKSA